MQTPNVTEVMEKVKIGGIKLSEKLIQLHLLDQDSYTSSILPLSQILKKNKINMPFISTLFSSEGCLFTCCISTEDIHCVKGLVETIDILDRQVRFIHDVGLISVFPHRSSFKILGLSLCALENAGIPLFGMCSSVSSLTFVSKYAMLNKAVAALMNYLDLPDGYVPSGSDIY
ncbi:MAG: hypothetical protein JRJ39_07460 [Deltaproteobacteria bacterium]|nr:hypothetical protein [Deltaproteobacteria bacterium]